MDDLQWKKTMEMWKEERLDAAREAAVCATSWQEEMFVTQAAAKRIKADVHCLVHKERDKLTSALIDKYKLPQDEVTTHSFVEEFP